MYIHTYQTRVALLERSSCEPSDFTSCIGKVDFALHMSELAAILARRRISDGHTLVTKQEGELVKNDVEDGTQTSKALAAPIQSADKHGTDRGDDIADIDDIRRLAADTDNVAIEVLENIKGDAVKNDLDTNFASTSSTTSSQPGNLETKKTFKCH